MDIIVNLAIFLVLIVISAYFAAAEVALLSISRLKVRHLLAQNRKGAHYIRMLKEDPDRLLSTVLIGNNLANVAASVIATAIAFDLFRSYALGIATGATTLMVLFFGDMLPKSLAAKYNVRMGLWIARPTWVLSIICYPATKVLKSLLGPLNPKSMEPIVTVEELKSYVEAGHEEGSIREFEKKMIHRIFEFDQIHVSEIMTPKIDMIMANANDRISKAVNSPTAKLYSRIPVYRKSRDHIVGIFNVKDALRNFDMKRLNDKVKIHMRKAIFVPETLRIDKLLRIFQKGNEHMAIVVNEHGSITGLVTIENVLEEIVGEIKDETDRADGHVKRIDSNFWYVKGSTNIEELEEKIGLKVKKPARFDTFNGLIIQRFGRLPKVGEEIRHDDFNIKIEDIDHYRVELASVTKTEYKAKTPSKSQ